MRKFLWCWVCVGMLSACAHRGAVRVECEGPLRPINLPPSQDPVEITPATKSDSPPAEKQP